VTEKKKLVVLLKQHCSPKGETAKQFVDELKKLTDEDRASFAEQFRKELGYEVEV